MTTHPVTRTLTDTLAGASLSTPFWIDQLHQASDVAALCLPILGALWLSVQIIGYFFKDKRDD